MVKIETKLEIPKHSDAKVLIYPHLVEIGKLTNLN